MKKKEGAGKRKEVTSVVCLSEFWWDGDERTGAGRTVGVSHTVLYALFGVALDTS